MQQARGLPQDAYSHRPSDRAESGGGSSSYFMPPTASQDTAGKIAHTGSVYTFILFMPPLSRKATGHYWTPEVGLAFALFFMSVTLQLCLTLIAGAAIVQQQHDVRNALIQDDTLHHTRLNAYYEETLRIAESGNEWAPRVFRHLGAHRWFRDYMEGRDPKPPLQLKKKQPQCCWGAACAGRSKCCDTQADLMSFAAGNNFTEASWDDDSPTRLFLRKPAAKAKVNSENPTVGQVTTSICTGIDGITTCVPPSVAILGAWHELDENKDGVWSIDEAQRDSRNYGCHMAVHLEDVFRAACQGIIRDVQDAEMSGGPKIYLPESLRRRTAIPRAHFQWWRGLAVMCIQTNSAMCGELLLRGTFDGALTNESNNTRGGMVDLDTALAYCERLLAPGGICDTALPGSYAVFRARVKDGCGTTSPNYGKRYTNPHNQDDISPVLSASWTKLADIERIHGFAFQFFMTLILVLWYINLLDEFKEIVHLWDLLRNFPVEEEWPFVTPEFSKDLRHLRRTMRRHLTRFSSGDLECKDETDDEGEPLQPKWSLPVEEWNMTISSFERPHQLTVITMASIRSVLLVYLGYSGTYFLLSNMSYIDLLLNALALAFIFELDEFLYTFLVPEATKTKLDQMAPLEFATSLPQEGVGHLLFTKCFWGLLVVPVLSWYVVYSNDTSHTLPTLKALRCACMQGGDSCLAATLFTRSWWNNYWHEMALLRQSGQL